MSKNGVPIIGLQREQETNQIAELEHRFVGGLLDVMGAAKTNRDKLDVARKTLEVQLVVWTKLLAIQGIAPIANAQIAAIRKTLELTEVKDSFVDKIMDSMGLVNGEKKHQESTPSQDDVGRQKRECNREDSRTTGSDDDRACCGRSETEPA